MLFGTLFSSLNHWRVVHIQALFVDYYMPVNWKYSYKIESFGRIGVGSGWKFLLVSSLDEPA